MTGGKQSSSCCREVLQILWIQTEYQPKLGRSNVTPQATNQLRYLNYFDPVGLN